MSSFPLAASADSLGLDASELYATALAASIFLGTTASVGLSLLNELSRHGQESLLHVLCALRTGLQKCHANLIGIFLGLVSLDDPIGNSIGLVSHQQLCGTLRRVSVHLLEPVANVIEGIRRCYIVHHNDAIGTTVVRRSDGPEPLLSGRVPNLQFHGLVVYFYSTESKVNANG